MDRVDECGKGAGIPMGDHLQAEALSKANEGCVFSLGELLGVRMRDETPTGDPAGGDDEVLAGEQAQGLAASEENTGIISV